MHFFHITQHDNFTIEKSEYAHVHIGTQSRKIISDPTKEKTYG